MKTITKEMLEAEKACGKQVAVFVRLFGDEAEVTEANAMKALAASLDIFFLERFVPAPALADYKRVKAQAWAEYERVKAQAVAEYERVKAQAVAEYERVKAPAWADYKRVEAQAWAEYERVEAQAVVAALLAG